MKTVFERIFKFFFYYTFSNITLHITNKHILECVLHESLHSLSFFSAPYATVILEQIYTRMLVLNTGFLAELSNLSLPLKCAFKFLWKGLFLNFSYQPCVFELTLFGIVLYLANIVKFFHGC